MRLLSGLLLVVLLFVGCSSDERNMQLIGEAESVMIEHPDSALNIIRSIDVATIHGDEDMAHYRLVLAEACYYNRVPVGRDSIAEPLFEYYLDSDDHAMRARAMYQHALVMQSERENARAMYSLMEAEKSLKHIDNPRLLGLVHRSKGDLYGIECLFELSKEEYEKAAQIFKSSRLDSHYLYALYDVATACNHLREYDESIEILDNLNLLSYEHGDHLLHYISLINLCYNYIEIGDYESCYSVFLSIEPTSYNGYSLCDYYCINAIIESWRGNYQLSCDLLSEAKNLPITSQIMLNYSEYMIYKLSGHSDIALDKYRALISEQDKNVYNLIHNSILQSQVDLLSDQIESTEKLQTKNRLLFGLSAGIGVIILLILIYTIVHRHQKHKQEIRHYLETISDFELLSKDVNKSANSELDTAIDMLYRQSLIEINELCEIYYEQSGSSRLASKIVEKVIKNIERLKNDQQRIAELESAVNVSQNDIMKKLREQCPKLSERDTRIALYTYAGFSNRAISLLVGCTSESLPKIKYNIRELIKSCQVPDMRTLTEPLYNKKHS